MLADNFSRKLIIQIKTIHKRAKLIFIPTIQYSIFLNTASYTLIYFRKKIFHLTWSRSNLGFQIVMIVNHSSLPNYVESRAYDEASPSLRLVVLALRPLQSHPLFVF